MSTFIDRKELYSQAPPPFGHELLKYFALDPKYTNLNNGSYGTTPKPVLEAALELSYEIEANPDKFHRLLYQKRLIEARTQAAKLVNAHVDEIVFVPNATTGTNTVLRNFEWESGDVIIDFTTSFASTRSTTTYISETAPHPKHSSVLLTFPVTAEKIIEIFRAHLKSPEAQAGGKNNKRIAVIDGIISNPGILLPWKELVQVCKEEDVWSHVDGAHSVGQEVGIDLEAAKPDFWVSNCHKWLYGKRSCALLYIPFRNQHVIKSSLPTSSSYEPNSSNIILQHEWSATTDQTPYLTLTEALKFRQWLGGEKAINDYCHNLALQGGKYLAELWGTSLMDADGSQTLNMVNVELPIPGSISTSPALTEFIENKLLHEHNAYSAWFVHNGKWWTRCSAQTYNDITDFEKLGQVWLEVVKDIQKQVEETK